MKEPDEGFREVKLFGFQGDSIIKVAYSSDADKAMIEGSNFMCAGGAVNCPTINHEKPLKIISFMNSLGEHMVGVWYLSVNDIYHLESDIDVTSDISLKVNKVMINGSKMSTNVSLVN